MTIRDPDREWLATVGIATTVFDRDVAVALSAGGLRSLIAANHLVTAYTGFDDLLDRILEAAGHLTGARSGALVVHDAQNEVAAAHYLGFDADPTMAQLQRSEGRMLDLIDGSRSVLLGGDDTSSVVLGARLELSGEPAAALWLASPEHGRFSDEDAALLDAFIGTASMALHNARLGQEIGHARDWLRASAGITRLILGSGPDMGDALLRIARTAMRLVGADEAVIVRTASAVVTVEASTGPYAGADFESTGRLARLISAGGPIRFAAAADAGLPDSPDATALGPVLLAPMTGDFSTRGAVILARHRGRAAFTDTNLETASTFAGQMALAMELSEARSESDRVRILDERDRIGRELHDTVIQRLFAIGLGLEGTMATDRADAMRRLAGYITDLDETITTIRTTVFELGAGSPPARVP
jgi:GAF domain-containing protein